MTLLPIKNNVKTVYKTNHVLKYMLNYWRDCTGVVKLYSMYVHICTFKLYSQKQKLYAFKKVRIIKVIQIIP